MKKKLNILQVLPSLESGGVERGTLELANYLVSKGHGSYVISFGGRLVKELTDHGTKHTKINIGRKSLFTFLYIPKIIHFIKENKIDIVHVRSRFPAWVIYMALFFVGKNRPRFVTTVHGYNSVSIYSKIMTKGDKVVVVSKFIQDFIIKTYKVNKSKTVLIHRGVPTQLKPLKKNEFLLWKKSFKKNFTQLRDCKILILSARVSRTKGIEVFINLIEKLVKEKRKIHGIIVGEAKSSHYHNQLIKKINELGIEKKVTFLGYREDIYNIIQYSDISYCLSSTPEPFGRGVIESIKLGTPVIAFDHGGAGEQLKEIFPEGLVKNNDFINLYEKSVTFLNKKPTIKKTNSFSLETMVKKTLDLYRDLIE